MYQAPPGPPLQQLRKALVEADRAFSGIVLAEDAFIKKVEAQRGLLEHATSIALYPGRGANKALEDLLRSVRQASAELGVLVKERREELGRQTLFAPPGGY